MGWTSFRQRVCVCVSVDCACRVLGNIYSVLVNNQDPEVQVGIYASLILK